MLQAAKVSKRFGNRLVLRGVSFEAATGETVAIVGANGAGKSTLLRVVAGLLAPTVGTLSWNGETTRGHCALAAPGAPLYRELTVLENLRFFDQTAALEQALVSHLDGWALAPRKNDLWGELSSGLRARAQLAVAAWNRPRILLLDEPTANLDGAGRALVAKLIEQQRGRGVTLLATNDSRDLEWCSREVAL